MGVFVNRYHKIVTLPTRIIARVCVEIKHHPLFSELAKWRNVVAGLSIEVDVFCIFRHLYKLKIVAACFVF